MTSTLVNLLRDRAGATAIEYGLIAALISIVIVAALTATGRSLDATFDRVRDALR